MVAPEYARRRVLAKEIGLGRKRARPWRRKNTRRG